MTGYSLAFHRTYKMHMPLTHTQSAALLKWKYQALQAAACLERGRGMAGYSDHCHDCHQSTELIAGNTLLVRTIGAPLTVSETDS